MTKLLLTGVVKPYGVDEDFGEALCTMELLNNQVTREQGIHSPRSNNLSFGLYMMAENIYVPSTVLDFPSWKDFTQEIDKGDYSHVGISFIVPNVMKARRMVEYIRQQRPEIKIILGGHGAAIPDLKNVIDYDEVCRGEGIAWLRKYFGEDPQREIIHPAIQTSVNKRIYGAPIIEQAGIIIPGVGCQNSCRFCATSHKFDRKYTPFLKSGRDIFAACYKAERELSVTDFGLMDENFCKQPARAIELLKEIENADKPYTFATFSSAETIKTLGVDFLTRLGVNFLWIGVESKANVFEKTHGIDVKSMIAELQTHGVTVLASAILFMEHHDKQTIEDDIEWAIDLESDLLQFMHFTPVPGTRLYKEYAEAGILLEDMPWQKQHGQDTIAFEHPHFSQEESFEYLKNAFIRKYQAHGPSVLNMARTALQGYRTVSREIIQHQMSGLAWDPATLRYSRKTASPLDSFMRLRLEKMKHGALKFRPILSVMKQYAPNAAAARKAQMVIEEFQKTFGSMTLKEQALGLMVRGTAWLENLRYRKNGVIMRQPPMLRKEYPQRYPAAIPMLEAEEPAA
jgi:hypothetical protein